MPSTSISVVNMMIKKILVSPFFFNFYSMWYKYLWKQTEHVAGRKGQDVNWQTKWL